MLRRGGTELRVCGFASRRLCRASARVAGLATDTGKELSSDDYLHEILKATRVYDVCEETRLDHAKTLSKRYGNDIFLKREDMQPVFSFKLRGAYNKIASLTEEERERGIVACSAGNHAQGVALSAEKLGVDGIIVMPLGTPSIKVDGVKKFGGLCCKVVLHGENYDEAQAEARRLEEVEGRAMIHPFDDPIVIAGQGTIATEILKQIRKGSKRLDAIFVCCGGGGLLAGVLAYVKRVNPEVRVFGVEAEDAAGMYASVEKGKPVALDSVGLFADGAAVRQIGSETFRVIHALSGQKLEDMITVDNDQICAAIKDGFADTRGILEPAGALALAGLTKYMEENPEEMGKTYVAIASGANMDFDRLRFVSERADASESLLSIRIKDRPGTFDQLYNLVYPRNVTEFSYRITKRAAELVAKMQKRDTDEPHEDAHVIMTYQPRDAEDAKAVMEQLSAHGYVVTDLNGDEMAKAHGRHLAGGRAPGIQHEHLYRFAFPERPGALRRFFDQMHEYDRSGDEKERRTWNLSLFHYRNHGADYGRVLVGFQVPPDEVETFEQFIEGIQGFGYKSFKESNSTVYEQFLK